MKENTCEIFRNRWEETINMNITKFSFEKYEIC